ncbi:MAG: ribosome maturation factor RimM [Rhodocyclaceae bacterium]|nr:ribosome maturation factor RimM [Rhodocyclaceae bacterium]
MIVLGRIVAPYGVQGWLRLHAFGDEPLAWGQMQNLWFSADENAQAEHWRAIDLEQVKNHGDKVVIKFKDISDRDSAERFAPCFVGAPREALPKTSADEYYWSDLIGLTVVNLSDANLGKVKTLLESGANAVLVVEGPDRQRLLPFVAQIVKSVDLKRKLVVVDWEADW